MVHVKQNDMMAIAKGKLFLTKEHWYMLMIFIYMWKLSFPATIVITDSGKDHQWILKILGASLGEIGIHATSESPPNYLLITKCKTHFYNAEIG